MEEWLIFILFILVGVGLLCKGLIYLYKEKNDPESIKIYGIISIVGAILAIIGILIKFVFCRSNLSILSESVFHICKPY